MYYVTKDEEFTVAIDFKVMENYVYPDEGKYSYKLRKTDGTLLTSGEGSLEQSEETELNEEPKVTDQVIITIPAEYNTKDEGLFSTRLIELSFKYQGKYQSITTTYRIVDFYHFSATMQDVRDYYGVNSGELPDGAVDLVEVYLELLKKHGTTLTDCLNSSSIGNFRANRLITLKAVVKIFPSLKLRTNQEESDGSSKFIRYMKFDWDDLLQSALDEISDLENNLSGEEETNYTSYTPLILGSVVDAITGSEE